MPSDEIDIPSGLILEPMVLGLELRRVEDPPGQGVRAELAAIRRGSHPLARAIRGVEGPVIDATTGLGGDTAVLASLGREVFAIERNPVLARMLQDAHERLDDRAQADRIHLHRGDACRILAEAEDPFTHPAAIVLDPMYPTRRSASALPTKPMQLLRELLAGHTTSDDTENLIACAFATRARRVVLKRPPEALPPDSRGKPTFSIESKLVRWDVWERGQSSVMP
ncbi:MAG: class I SAM-dependent methyltransferase [Phycisphaerales bacterium]|jgi:16S rRNA (guanine1516-N2)-methyltransferase|nr:class I SAM-dependent methyltransferase [Phycisphaerales bacterium]